MNALARIPPSALEGEVLGPADETPIIFWRSPFQQQTQMFVMPVGCSIQDAVDLTGVRGRLLAQVCAYIDEHKIPRALWKRVRPKPGVPIYLRVELGKSDSKNPLRFILQLAVVVAAAFLAPFVAPFLGVTGILATAVTVAASFAILSIGTALVNALIPPPKTNTNYTFDQQPGNPYAQLTGLRNVYPRLGDPIPRIIGERRLYPMLAARPYTESQGSTQYLRMLLLVGYGPLDISDIRIGTTPLSDFAGAEYEIREGWSTDTDVTLYTRQIHEESLSSLLSPSTPVTHSTQTDTTEVSIDITFPQGLTTYNSSGVRTNRTVQFTVEYSGDGGSTWHDAVWINGESKYGTGTTGQINATDSDVATVVRSGRFSLPSAGTYSIRVTRTTSAGSSLDVDSGYWTVLRSIKPEAPINKTGLALIALRLKATQQLNGIPDAINCLAKSYLPVYDPDTATWDYEISRSPAWAFADMFRRRGLDTILADSRLDLDTLLEWDEACAATAPNADEPTWQCDLVIEGGSIATAAQAIAAYGRAQFTIIDDQYSVVRDVAQVTPVQAISSRNSSGYQWTRAFAELPHALRVTFINPAFDSQDEIVVYRDGYNADGSGGMIAATKFDMLDLPGCRSHSMAWREARYYLKVAEARSEEHTVTMDIEAIRCVKGDLVRFSHDVVSIGLGEGRIVDVTLNDSGLISQIVTDTPVDMANGTTYGVRVRAENQTQTVHTLATTPGTGYTVLTLATPVAVEGGPAAGDLFQFGEGGTETEPMIVKSIDRGGELSARVTMVAADPEIWTTDQGDIPEFTSGIVVGWPADQIAPPEPTFTLTSGSQKIQAVPSGNFGLFGKYNIIIRVEVALKPSAPSSTPATKWEVQWRDSSGNADWQSSGPIDINVGSWFLDLVKKDFTYDFRVRTLSASGVPSAWASYDDYAVGGHTTTPAGVTDLAIVAYPDGVTLTWTPSASPYVSAVEIRKGGSDWDSATLLDSAVAGDTKFYPITLTSAVVFRVKARDNAGNYSAESTVTSPSSNAVNIAGQVLSTAFIPQGSGVNLGVPGKSEVLFAADGDTISYGPYAQVPIFQISSAGLAAPGSGQKYKLSVADATNSGGAATLKFLDAPSLTQITDGAMTTPGGSPTWQCDKSDEDAADDRYRFRVQGHHEGTTLFWVDEGGYHEYLDASLNLEFWANDGGGWESMGSAAPALGDYDQTFEITWTNPIGSSSAKFGVSIYSGGASDTITGVPSVKYWINDTTPSYTTASPNGETAQIIVTPRPSTT